MVRWYTMSSGLHLSSRTEIDTFILRNINSELGKESLLYIEV